MYRMNQKKIVMIAVAVSLSFAWLSFAWIKHQTPLSPRSADAGESRSVLVAASDIPGRMTLSDRMLVRTAVPAALYNEQMLTGLDPARRQFARHSVSKGEILYRSKIGVVGEEAELSYMVDWNQGCITLQVTDITGISGLLRPGDYVDVYATYARDQLDGLPVQGQLESVTKRIVSGVRVVAADNEVLPPVEAGAGDGQFNRQRAAGDLKRVTLAAGHADIEKLIHAHTNGRIHLSLLSGKDADKTDPAGFGAQQLYEELFNKQVHAIECIRPGKTEVVYVEGGRSIRPPERAPVKKAATAERLPNVVEPKPPTRRDTAVKDISAVTVPTEDLYNRAVAWHDAGNYADAERAFLQVIEAWPSYSKPYKNLARARLELGKTSEALQNALVARELNPRDGEIDHTLGRIHMAAGDAAAGADAYESAIEKSPNFAWAYNNLGYHYIQQGAFEKAVEILSAGAKQVNPPAVLLRNLQFAQEHVQGPAPGSNLYANARDVSP